MEQGLIMSACLVCSSAICEFKRWQDGCHGRNVSKSAVEAQRNFLFGSGGAVGHLAPHAAGLLEFIFLYIVKFIALSFYCFYNFSLFNVLLLNFASFQFSLLQQSILIGISFILFINNMNL